MTPDFWRECAEANMDAVQDAAGSRLHRISQAHLQAIWDLTTQMEKIIGRYPTRMNLTWQKAKEFLREPLDKNSWAYGYRMTRGEALRQAVQEQAGKLAELERLEIKAQRGYTAKESFRQAGELLERMGMNTKGVSSGFGGPAQSLNSHWAGRSYSDSIYVNASMLADRLEKEITDAFLKGRSDMSISEIITEHFGLAFRQAERLMRTETSYVHNQAALERYQKAGLERFEFLTAKDSRTCPICAKRNGDVVPLEDGEPGKNMPPMHPWCRCAVLPVVEAAAENPLQSELGSDTMEMPDVKIFHGVGAKARTYDIYDTAGNLYHYAEGTWVKNVEVFAGYKVKTPLHEGVAEGLSEEYGGSPEKWQHVKGIGTIDDAGDYVQAEVHWFQEESVGQVRHRVKRWLE